MPMCCLADSVLDESLGVNIRSMFFDDSVASWMTAADYQDEAAARDALNRQEIGVAVIIPARLHRKSDGWRNGITGYYP